jgi:hypothetical protein
VTPEREARRARRSTALSGVLLALLLLGGALVSRAAGPDDGPTATSPASVPVAPPGAATPSSTPAPGPSVAPRPGPAYAVREVGGLGGRTRIVSGRGAAEVRWARTPGQATRFHLICTGCDAGTWLVEWPRGPVPGPGPLPDPSGATGVLDVAAPGRTSRLLVRAATGAEWTLTLTPFDAVPVHREGFDGLGEDVVAVRAASGVRLTCADGPRVRTLARPAGRPEYAVVETVHGEGGGTSALRVPAGADLLVLQVGCSGRWTVTLA